MLLIGPGWSSPSKRSSVRHLYDKPKILMPAPHSCSTKHEAYQTHLPPNQIGYGGLPSPASTILPAMASTEDRCDRPSSFGEIGVYTEAGVVPLLDKSLEWDEADDLDVSLRAKVAGECADLLAVMLFPNRDGSGMIGGRMPGGTMASLPSNVTILGSLGGMTVWSSRLEILSGPGRKGMVGLTVGLSETYLCDDGEVESDGGEEGRPCRLIPDAVVPGYSIIGDVRALVEDGAPSASV